MEYRRTWDYFFTITLKPACHHDSWNKQRTYFERFINSIQHHHLTCILELHKNGVYHIHGMASFLYHPNDDHIDFRKYFFKMKNKIKELGKADFQTCDDYNACMEYIFKDVHNGYIINPILIDDYNRA